MKYLFALGFSGLMLFSTAGISATPEVNVSDLKLVDEQVAPPANTPDAWYYGRYYGRGYGRYYGGYGRYYGGYGRYYGRGYGRWGRWAPHSGETPESLPAPQVPDNQ